MKNKHAFPVLALLSVTLLCSCQKPTPSPSEYVSEMNLFSTKEEVRILQLTDNHWSFHSDLPREKAYLTALIKNSEPDIVMCTGDQFLSVNTDIVDKIYATIDEVCGEIGAKWGVTFGNHEKQGYYSPSYPDQVLKTKVNTFYKGLDDNLTGQSNYVLNLTDGTKTIWQLYSIDSGSFEYPGVGISYDYASIEKDQIDWYVDQSNAAKAANADVQSLLFYHIPLWQVAYAYRLSQGETAPGEINSFVGTCEEPVWTIDGLGSTPVYAGARDTGLFAAAEAQNNCRGMFFGHDHLNDFAATYRDDPTKDFIPLVYGLKSSDGLTFIDGKIGGTIIRARKNGTISYERAYQTYQQDYSGQAGFRIQEMNL